MFQYLGLILVVFSWAGGAYLLTKWRNKTLHTISKHAASSPEANLFFASLLTVLGSLFYWWLVAWFVPHLRLGVLFVVLATLTIGCQILTGIFPDTTGWRRQIHRITAYTMAVSYLPLAAIIILSPLSLTTRLLCIAITGYMVCTFTLLVLMKRAQKRYLAFQALYVVAFQMVILIAGYLF
jgi:hypothetical protein